MHHKIVLRARAITYTTTLLLFVFIVIIPLGHAVEWSPDMRITWDNGLDRFPSIVQTGDGKIWVVWESIREENLDIFYKVYDGSHVHPWSPDTRLTTDQSADGSPSIMQALDGRIWVVWGSYRTGNSDIYGKTYNGTGWSFEELLIADPSVDRDPSIMQTSDGTIWLVFASNRTGNRDIYYATSSDNGETWEESLLPTSDPIVPDSAPSIMQATGGTIWLVWESDYFDIFYVTYNGTSWSSKATVTTHHRDDVNPSIMQAQDESIWVVWDSDRDSPKQDPYGNLYYNIYDGGWSGDMSLTTTTDDDAGASILQAIDGTLWIAWTSWRYYTQDIYYRTNSTAPQNDVAVFSVSPRKPTVTQGKNVNIEVVAQNKGTNAQTTQVSCYANSTLIGNETVSIIPGQLNTTVFTWNTSGIPVGTYVLWANASVVAGETYTEDNTFVDGTLHVVTHDVAVMEVTPSQTIAHKGYTTMVYIYVRVKNEGNFTETFNVTAKRNSNAIGTQTVIGLAPSAEIMLTFPWNIEAYSYSVWNISAWASILEDENDTADNSLEGGTVMVTIAGDVDGSKAVNLLDMGATSAHWYNPPVVGSDGYDLNVDINQDGEIDIFDSAIVNMFWEQYW